MTSPTGAGEGEVSSCVSNLIHAFTNGLDVFKRLRDRRRKRKSRKSNGQTDPTSGAELQLSTSLRRGPADIQSSYEKHFSKAGDRFAKGDAIAHASLAETLIKLNTGLVGIIATFLNHDSKNTHLNLDYKSLTDLSNASRVEAVESLNQLYHRLSKSQLQLYRVDDHRRRSQPDRRRHNGSSSRINSPTVARIPIKSTSQKHLVVVRPKATRKGSAGSSSSTSTTSPHSSAHNSPYATPLESPLPQYSPTDPFPRKAAPHSRKQAQPARRSIDGPRPTTWPHTGPNKTLSMPLTAPPRPPKIPISQRTSPLREKNASSTPSSPFELPYRRRLDKITPSTYTFASNSTKLGEIPQRKWTTPWNYAEAERLNKEALLHGYPAPPVQAKPKTKKGLFNFLKRGTTETT